MVNLLERRAAGGGFARFDPPQCERIEVRLSLIADLARHDRLGPEAVDTALLASEIEELDSAPTRVAALALLETIDALRREAVAALSVDVSGPSDLARRAALLEDADFVCHRPGRSLITGEAEIASRGYFDAEDRPPLACWIGVLASAATNAADEADFVIVAWTSPGDRERARAGRQACPNGALALIAELSPPAADQLRACAEAAAAGASPTFDSHPSGDRQSARTGCEPIAWIRRLWSRS